MTADPPAIDVDRVGRLIPLGTDGTGQLFAVPAVQINQAWPAVYKEYLAPVLERVDAAALGRVVAELAQLDADDSRWLADRTAWPAALITRAGSLSGYLMRQVPEKFALATAGGGRTPAAARNLIADPHLPDQVRLEFLLDLAGTLIGLGRWEITAPALVPDNVLFATAGRPRCFLTHCDMLAMHGVAPLAATVPVDAPMAFAQLVVQVLSRDPTARDPATLSASYPELVGPVGLVDWVGSLTAAIVRQAVAPPPSYRVFGPPIATAAPAAPFAEASGQRVSLTKPPTPAAGPAQPPAGPAQPVEPTLLGSYEVLAPSGGPADPGPPVDPGLLPGPAPGQPPADNRGWPTPEPVLDLSAQPGYPPPGPGPRPAPAPGPAPGPTGHGRQGRLIAMIAATAFAVLLIAVAGVVFVIRRSSSHEPAQPPATPLSATSASTASRSPSPSASRSSEPPSPTPAPGRVGVVDASVVIADPKAVDIATMFDTYFSSINGHDYARALSVYDPAGIIQPGDPQQAQKFQHDVSTSTDTDVRLLSIGPGDGGRVAAQARVAFRSNQQPGFGPRGREGETCTLWSVTYSLTNPAARQYRILRATGASNEPCR
jgi:hypothetical protein